MAKKPAHELRQPPHPSAPTATTTAAATQKQTHLRTCSLHVYKYPSHQKRGFAATRNLDNLPRRKGRRRRYKKKNPPCYYLCIMLFASPSSAFTLLPGSIRQNKTISHQQIPEWRKKIAPECLRKKKQKKKTTKQTHAHVRGVLGLKAKRWLRRNPLHILLTSEARQVQRPV